jgi:hypothetical protein
MKFATEFDHPIFPGEKGGGGVSMVEMAGYIPADVQITDMINAGARLSYARAQQYDFADGEEDDGSFIDPTRRPDFDLADASSLQDLAEARLEEQAKQYKKTQDEEAKKQKEEYEKYLEAVKAAKDGNS